MDVELRFIANGSYKFYRVWTETNRGQHIARGQYGRIGNIQGEPIFYTGDDFADAEDAAQKQLAKKMAKGYKIYKDNGVVRDPSLT